MVEIFIVDPHQLTRVGLVTVLSQEEELNICGFADSPESALGEIFDLKPNLILVDLPLLGDSGVELAELIKIRLPESKLVVFSASSDDSSLLRVMGAGAHAYIFKGCSAEMLTCALRAVNAGASWMDPLIARRLIELNLSALWY
ncbi:response regulator transcription factor [Candidatus Obscuribacterales bacterium]|nr:response regulator transcription factor [Candidatus Obscuribacterales bacterium]